MAETKGEKCSSQCRLCMSTEKGQLQIFGPDGTTRNLATKIKDCLPVSVQQEDELPKWMCRPCVQKLEQFHQFRETCAKTEATLAAAAKEFTSSALEPECCLREALEGTNQEPVQQPDVQQSKTKLNGMDVDPHIDPEDSMSEHGQTSLFSNTTTGSEPNNIGSKSRLGQPGPDDYVLVSEKTFVVDERKVLSGQIEWYSAGRDSDITAAQRRRREVLPAMWDVYERSATMKGGVTHRRYLINKGAFPCSLCGKCFSMTQGRRREGDEDSDTTPSAGVHFYNCHMCGKVFDRRSSLKRHQVTHEETKPFTCPLCSKGFNRKEHLSRHTASHSGGRPYNCDLCYKPFFRKEHLTRHRLSHPEVVKIEKLEEAADSTSIALSSDANIMKRPFICNVCQQGYSKRELLVRHQRQVHGIHASQDGFIEIKLKPYSCSLCLKSFTRKEHLVRHQKIHSRASLLGLTPAPTSPQPTEGDTAELQHEVSNGTLALPPDIDLSLIEGGWLQGDFSEGEGVTTEDPSSSDYFADDFSPAPKPHPCPSCPDRSFSRRSHLMRHFKHFHPDKPLTLVNADGGTQYDEYLLSNGQYLCTICSKTFGRRYHLVRHMKLHGPDEVARPFRCQACGSSFSRHEYYVSHKCRAPETAAAGTSDDGDKPVRRETRRRSRGGYECDVCGLNFSKRRLHKRHMAAAHPDEVSSSPGD